MGKDQHTSDRVSAFRKVLRFGIWAAVFLALVGVTVFAGFEIGHRQIYPYKVLAEVDRKIGQRIFPPPSVESRVYPTHLLRLFFDVGRVELRREQRGSAGGGLTSFGPDVLLLPYDGRIYAASSSRSIRATRVRAPDNNRAAYVALADNPEFAQYQFHKAYLRYNDLLHFDGPAGQGLIASYTEYHPDRVCYTNTLARLDIDRAVKSIDEVEAGPEDWKTLYRTSPCLAFKRKQLALEGHMAGGRLAFAAPSTLYMTSGDFHLDGMRSEGAGIAQDPEAEYGKVLAIDIQTGKGHILSTGHRNAQGIARTSDGRLFVIEHGPRGGDELNEVRAGANYGWPLESYGTTYSMTHIPGSLSYGRHDNFEPPTLAWLPSIAPSGLTEIHGFHSAWDGDLLVCSLRDQSLHRIRMAGPVAVYSERIEIGARIRAVHQHTDGRLVLWADQSQELVFLSAADLINLDKSLKDFTRKSDLPERLEAQLQATVERCSECHSFAVDDHGRAPSLARIFGDAVAATSYADYSSALKQKGGEWTRDALVAFLTDPQAFAPGTSMPAPLIGEPQILDTLISFLETLDSEF